MSFCLKIAYKIIQPSNIHRISYKRSTAGRRTPFHIEPLAQPANLMNLGLANNFVMINNKALSGFILSTKIDGFKVLFNARWSHTVVTNSQSTQYTSFTFEIFLGLYYMFLFVYQYYSLYLIISFKILSRQQLNYYLILFRSNMHIYEQRKHESSIF